MVIGHVLPERNESLLEAYEKCRSSADSKSCCDYALHVGVTWWGPKVPKHNISSIPHVHLIVLLVCIHYCCPVLFLFLLSVCNLITSACYYIN